MEQAIFQLLQTIEARLERIERRLFEPMSEQLDQPLGALTELKKAEYPNDRQLDKLMAHAADGKALQNGIMRRPDGSRAP